MPKAKGKKRKNIPQKKVATHREETSSSLIVHPNATLTPDASIDPPTSGHWLARDSTNAPRIGEEEDEDKQEEYAGSHAALIDKYLLSRHSIPFIIALCIIGYIFIQDNGAGKLTSWDGVWWTIQKSGILLCLFVVIMLVQLLYRKIFSSKM